MTGATALQAERQHLAELLEAIQRCVFFLDASTQKIVWPITKLHLENHMKDVVLFESLSSINERFSKLQDTLGAAMRHAVILSGEASESFLRVLSFYEKAVGTRSGDAPASPKDAEASRAAFPRRPWER